MAVAELLWNNIPKLAHDLASVSNAGLQLPLQFERLTQIHEAVMHLVYPRPKYWH